MAAAKEPFLAYVAPKACHDPFVPAPWYATARPAGWPRAAPRPPSFNLSAAARARHHATVAAMGTVTDEVAACIDDDFANRWRTLMSVDDVIAALIGETDALGVTERTFFLFSSDHGYSLGELNLNWDKRNVYDFDTRIHLLVRGPGIAPGRAIAAPLTNVDLAPTILDMAGIFDYDAGDVDGRSLPLLLDDSDDDFMNPSSAWAADVYIEYTYIGIDGYRGMAEVIENGNFVAIRRVAGSAGATESWASDLSCTPSSSTAPTASTLACWTAHTRSFLHRRRSRQMHNVFANVSAEFKAARAPRWMRWTQQRRSAQSCASRLGCFFGRGQCPSLSLASRPRRRRRALAPRAPIDRQRRAQPNATAGAAGGNDKRHRIPMNGTEMASAVSAEDVEQREERMLARAHAPTRARTAPPPGAKARAPPGRRPRARRPGRKSGNRGAEKSACRRRLARAARRLLAERRGSGGRRQPARLPSGSRGTPYSVARAARRRRAARARRLLRCARTGGAASPSRAPAVGLSTATITPA